jgi:hypothetical protein
MSNETLDAGGRDFRFASSPASESFTDRQAGPGTLDAGGRDFRFASSPASVSFTDLQVGPGTQFQSGSTSTLNAHQNG